MNKNTPKSQEAVVHLRTRPWITIQHGTFLIIFLPTLQTIIIAQILSTEGRPM